MKFVIDRDYDKIIDLPHHTSKKHPQMSLHDRAAQFAPFAALVGYDDAIDETARITDSKKILSEDEKNILDIKQNILKESLCSSPEVSVDYFIADPHKQGGKYVIYTGILKRIAELERFLIFEDDTKIPLDDIIDIDCDIFKKYYFSE